MIFPKIVFFRRVELFQEGSGFLQEDSSVSGG